MNRVRTAITRSTERPPKTPDESNKLDVPGFAQKQDASADEQSAFDAFWQQCPEIDSPLLASAAMARGGFRFDLYAMILAGVLFAQHPKLDSARDDKHWTPWSGQ